MGLSDDQKALLRLLAGGQGYEDIAALLGTGADEVRAKAAAAVAQLEAEGIPAPALPDTPAGTAADPQPPSDPSPPPPPPAAPAPPAPEPPLKPEAADPGSPADPPASTAIKPSPPASSAAGRPKLSLPSDSGKRAALAAGAIVVALVVVIIIVSGGGGGGSSSTTAASTSPTSTEASETGESGEAQNTANGLTRKPTKAVLEPVGNDGAAGVAIFGRIKKSLALQVEATGLEPTTASDSYTVWLAQSPQKMLPLASTTVKKDGKIAAQFEVPVEVLAYLASATFDQITITKTDNAKLQAALKTATKEEKVPDYSGEAVLSGEITGPFIGAEKRIEERKKEEEKK